MPVEQMKPAADKSAAGASGDFAATMNGGSGPDAAQQAPLPDPAQAPQAVTGATAPQRVDPFSQLNRVYGEFMKVRQKHHDVEVKVAQGELSPSDPKVKRAQKDLMFDLINVQMRMQRAALGVELVSKVVEHGTSGMKTLMQTQM